MSGTNTSPTDRPQANPIVIVVAAVIVQDGRLLLTQRLKGSHLEGFWELPGGKIEPGEDPQTALRREIMEELGVSAEVGQELGFSYHAYPGRRVLLLAYWTSIEGTLHPLECAAVDWFTPGQVDRLQTPPADEPIFARLFPMLTSTEKMDGAT